jgi:hypothetical protein
MREAIRSSEADKAVACEPQCTAEVGTDPDIAVAVFGQCIDRAPTHTPCRRIAVETLAIEFADAFRRANPDLAVTRLKQVPNCSALESIG